MSTYSTYGASADILQQVESQRQAMRGARHAGVPIYYDAHIDLPSGCLTVDVKARLAVFGEATKSFVAMGTNFAKGERAYAALFKDMVECKGA